MKRDLDLLPALPHPPEHLARALLQFAARWYAARAQSEAKEATRREPGVGADHRRRLRGRRRAVLRAPVDRRAANAVMGGARPEHFPVVLAAMEALLDPAHNLNGVTQTTHMCVSLVIVNGPIARELAFNSRDGVFGNGYRANAAVGRAVRLALWNLGGAVPWDTDKSTLSHPAEYAFCIAEEEADNPWPPLHVERGCPEGSDAVTVFACEG